MIVVLFFSTTSILDMGFFETLIIGNEPEFLSEASHISGSLSSSKAVPESTVGVIVHSDPRLRLSTISHC
jgi:hypothetical protein